MEPCHLSCLCLIRESKVKCNLPGDSKQWPSESASNMEPTLNLQYVASFIASPTTGCGVAREITNT